MSIRTPDQRVRVFVSSTLPELADERQAVREAIQSLRLTPVMFEQGARPHPLRELNRAYLEQSDVFTIFGTGASASRGWPLAVDLDAAVADLIASQPSEQ